MSSPARFIPPETLLGAYAAGIFPMADNVDDTDIFWVDPDERGVLPLDEVHIPRRLKRTILHQPFDITFNTAFESVMENCRKSTPERPTSWINDIIRISYTELHHADHAHSIECWQNGDLVGGLYGVCLEGAFFGESMFSLQTDASKIALIYLAARLKYGGFSLLDCQFKTDHLAQFGVIEVPRGRYHTFLQTALDKPGNIHSMPVNMAPSDVLQVIGHKS